MEKRVVITGMGIYSCLGKNLDEVRDSLYNGVSGIILDQERKEMGFRSGLTSHLDSPDLKGQLSRGQRVFMPEQAKYAYVATVEALRNAKIDQDYLDKNDVGLLYGNDSSAEPVYKSVETMLRKKNTTLIGSGGIFQSGACASGSHAIGLGALLIRNGLQDMVVCGGAQEINPYAVGSFDGISAFSTREDAPTKASRPFDRDRDGLVPGGGAATVIIEDYEHAVKRGAPIIAEVLSWGFSSNGDHISSPNVAGPAKSLENAIKAANIPLSEIGYVNAHATSTHIGDTNEAKAIDQIFGSHKPFVTSTKSQTGHEMWMAGASEVIYSMLMMKNDFVAANLNFENPDEDSAKLNIPGARVSTHFDTFLSNSFGFGGTNSTLIVKDYKE